MIEYWIKGQDWKGMWVAEAFDTEKRIVVEIRKFTTKAKMYAWLKEMKKEQEHGTL